MTDNFKISTDIAVIKNELKNINKLLTTIAACNKEYDNRITELEKKNTELTTKIGTFAGIQVLFTAVVGAVIGYFRQ